MSSLVSLSHVGIAVDDLPGMKALLSILGLSVSQSETVEDQGVETHFIPGSSSKLATGASNVSLELLEPIDSDGPVARFLAKRGPGIHHLSFQVSQGELDRICERLREKDYRLVYPKPRAGAHGRRINFIHPASAGGILIELMEKGTA